MIVTGKRDVDPELPSHVPGVREGNAPKPRNRRISGSSRRSTGISPKKHGTIDPRMPKISPP